MELRQHTHHLLQEIGPGRMPSTAYDTAWVARLVEIGEPIGQQALEWLRENQLPDGTWGAGEPHYYHDRLVSTLAAMVALGKWGDSRDRNRLKRGVLGVDLSIRGLRADPAGETVGFEMIAPALMAEANALDLFGRNNGSDRLRLIYPYAKAALTSGETEHGRRYDDAALKALSERRGQKLQKLPRGKINRHVTLAFSAEMVGADGLHLLDADHLQESNGSVGHSPSATAHFVLHVRPQDPTALNYLRQTVAEQDDGGGAPDVAPFDTFERAWSLWNLSLPERALDAETRRLCQTHLDFLENAWKAGHGAGFAAEYTPKDGDDSGLVFDVLARFGRHPDLETLLQYEKEDHFRCFALESNPSISANIHILGALVQAGLTTDHPSVRKVVQFLNDSRYLGVFWYDKWHVSPYYPTAHAIIAGSACAPEMAVDAVEWIAGTQNKDGSWGYYAPNPEETAYCLQALLVWKRAGRTAPEDCIERGLDWLNTHLDAPYLPLWIGKSLYCPKQVVRSAVLSALALGLENTSCH